MPSASRKASAVWLNAGIGNRIIAGGCVTGGGGGLDAVGMKYGGG